MNFLIAIRNIFRHRLRSLITLSAIGFGGVAIIFMEGYFEDTFYKMRESQINAQTGHLQVFKNGYLTQGSFDPSAFLIRDAKSIKNILQTIDGVEDVSTRLEFTGLISSDEATTAYLGEGFDSTSEKYFSMKEMRRKEFAKKIGPHFSGILFDGKGLSYDDPYGMMMGNGLAKSLNVGVGDSLVLMCNTFKGSLNALDLTVRGIFTTAKKSSDDHAIRLTMGTTKDLLRTNGIHRFVIRLRNTDDTMRVQHEIKNKIAENKWDFEVVNWSDLNDFYAKTIALFSRIFIVIKFIVGIIVFISVYNTMNMAVTERTTEIGTLMAMGFNRKEILRLFLTEGLVLGVVGSLLGMIAGALITGIVSHIGILMPPSPREATFIGFHSRTSFLSGF